MSAEKSARFNIVDFFIIICLVAACCFFSYYAASHAKKNAAAQSSMLYYSLEMKNLSASSADLFVVGDNVSLAKTFAPAGTITEVKKLAHTYPVLNSSGDAYVYKTDSSRFDVIITVKTGFSQTDSSFEVGGENIKVGRQMNVFTDRISFSGTVCDIKPEN